MYRLTIPHTSLISGIMRVFVRTDPQYSDDCDLPINVEVDLIESGNSQFVYILFYLLQLSFLFFLSFFIFYFFLEGS